ncbi:hypothetical protein AGABI2DRAFT_120013 [Agaricus bisporus var. bisporus H97]|uniref:hypothetical protein n=1 Tax=Agaricus bisporus var. bisporus (strain H97 / ATCC MYA-4626 / FGSC 10389) TaxID=936046 RepID=UPI00029F6907|nr:hypothetical protein AGABI2DRAFT_120013 [Agaricus bisporus var. bisporus H97]EKV45043.1 hypothetical protein AGABI2DRAFT_120013 [Agaricus bisporus var. bisporus H97]
MPAADSASQLDSEKERDRDRDGDRHDRSEKSTSKQKAASAATKSKDLSHVPCKFFKVGACTAGSSCPFSHTAAEPGAQKESCAWFVKGNCKFGHKCALAHILPGQSISMDRKNKKAAQQAAAAASGPGTSEKAGGKEGKKKRDGPGGQSSHTSGRNNSLLGGGSTAPTRLLSSNSTSSSSNRPLVSLKASISPSAPAPPLKDTEFASFAALDEMEGVQLAAPPAHRRSLAQEADADAADPASDSQSPPKSTSPPAALPPSAPRVTATMPPSDFGPIGSPPSSATRAQLSGGLNGGASTPGTSPRGSSHANGANLGTSPQGAFLSGSPFSAPGSQSVFLSSSYAGQGVAASLGSGLAMKGGRRGWADSDVSASPAKGGLSMLASSVQRSSLLNGNPRGEYAIDLEYEDYGPRKKRGGTVDDGDMEDFIPGSLTDLLTPEERNRRMSRSGGMNNPALPTNNNNLNPGELAAGGNRFGHRYSSSVPAPSLLGDIKSIWSDTPVGPLPSSPSHRGTPSTSYVTRFEGLNVNGGQQGTHDDMGLSISIGSTGAASSLGMMAPSNASAAFLPGLHQNYLKSKQQAQLGMGGGGGGGLSRGLRGSSGPLGNANLSSTAANYMSGQQQQQQQQQGTNNHGFTSSTNNTSSSTPMSQLPSYRGAPSPFDLTQPMHQAHHLHHPHHLHTQQQQQAPRPIPTSDNGKRLGGLGLGYGGAGAGAGGLGVGIGGGGAGGIGGGGGSIGGGGNGGGLGGGNGLNATNAGGLEGDILSGQFLSPNTRALQAHAPGQSLPQGLAAGYSRIHALPPLTSSPNVGSGNGMGGGGFVVENSGNNGLGLANANANVGGGVGMAGMMGMNAGAGAGEEWGVSSLPPQTLPLTTNREEDTTPSPSEAGKNGNNNNGAMMTGHQGGYMNAMNSGAGLTYSAAAKGGGSLHPGGGTTITGTANTTSTTSPTPPGLLKGRYMSPSSGIIPGGGVGGHGSGGSPLRPRDVDDDELFAMDK